MNAVRENVVLLQAAQRSAERFHRGLKARDSAAYRGVHAVGGVEQGAERRVHRAAAGIVAEAEGIGGIRGAGIRVQAELVHGGAPFNAVGRIHGFALLEAVRRLRFHGNRSFPGWYSNCNAQVKYKVYSKCFNALFRSALLYRMLLLFGLN